MDPWLVVVLAGLGAMKITELVKEIVPWPLQPWTKTAISLVVASALCALHSAAWRDRILLSIGSAGLSALWHEVAGTLSLASDNYKQQVILRAGTRRR